MKTIKFSSAPLLFAAMSFFLIGIISSCSQKVRFMNSTVVPTAQGSIKISKDDNNNHKIDIEIMRLANPERVTPSKKVYIVWMETDDNGTKNLGQLKSSDSFFSSTLKAEMHVATPFKPKKVFITAEDESNIQNPGTQVVLATNSF